MSVGAAIEVRSGPSARRQDILDAAETCFVRNGFHRTTMQDLARQAGMTAGNIYHYFKSKEAVVLGLAERERGHGMTLVEEMERAGDRRGALMSILKRYFARATRDSAILRVDLWSEATRNPDIAAMIDRGETEARLWFVETLSSLATSPACDAATLYDETLNPLMKGILVNLALRPAFDPAPAVAHLCALIEAGLAGRLPAVSLESESGAMPACLGLPSRPVLESSR
ncbi:TetR/AcrR family transcriptional regulator [Methylobacterium sp. W2]|uniref:TetR/AcrR family transcriptional regulator n=1 Tax=Methylobacterium sp. W2 TaxID=2598107 RepID=UPI001D0C38D6|nr:TetR/AcrR family transcriptional regulator [Methylobacterium sp. W2]MCC0809450.1 TetR/AcrR family transcriptional regulator [Methylobacterium sp. W2]